MSLHMLILIQAIFWIQGQVLGQIIRFLVILKILVMRLHRHFTELKNLDPWLRYETSKLVPTHTFLLKGMEKPAQKSPFSYVEIFLILLLITYGIPFLAKSSNFIGCTNDIKDLL